MECGILPATGGEKYGHPNSQIQIIENIFLEFQTANSISPNVKSLKAEKPRFDLFNTETPNFRKHQILSIILISTFL